MQGARAQEQEVHQTEQLDELLTGIAGGDRECFAELYSRTRAAVYGLALSYLKNPADAEDTTQDVFVQVWNCASGFRAQGRPMAWLMMVTRNMALEKLRRQSRREELTAEQWEAIPCKMQGVTPEDKTLLYNVMNRLSPEESRIVTLHAVGGMKHREVAKLLEMPLSTELSKYHRALKKLKSYLEGEDTP